MGKGKPRWYPKKYQNQLGNECEFLLDMGNGIKICENDGIKCTDINICKGDRHNCCKVKYHILASTNGKREC